MRKHILRLLATLLIMLSGSGDGGSIGTGGHHAPACRVTPTGITCVH